MKKCFPASQTSPPSIVPGAVISAGSGNHGRSAAATASDLSGTAGAPGPGDDGAPRGDEAASSTNVESGRSGSGPSRTSESPSRSSALQ